MHAQSQAASVYLWDTQSIAQSLPRSLLTVIVSANQDREYVESFKTYVLQPNLNEKKVFFENRS